MSHAHGRHRKVLATQPVADSFARQYSPSPGETPTRVARSQTVLSELTEHANELQSLVASMHESLIPRDRERLRQVWKSVDSEVYKLLCGVLDPVIGAQGNLMEFTGGPAPVDHVAVATAEPCTPPALDGHGSAIADGLEKVLSTIDPNSPAPQVAGASQPKVFAAPRGRAPRVTVHFDASGKKLPDDPRKLRGQGRLGHLTVDRLKSCCKTLGIPCGGRKADLLVRLEDRLKAADEGDADQPDEDDPHGDEEDSEEDAPGEGAEGHAPAVTKQSPGYGTAAGGIADSSASDGLLSSSLGFQLSSAHQALGMPRPAVTAAQPPAASAAVVQLQAAPRQRRRYVRKNQPDSDGDSDDAQALAVLAAPKPQIINRPQPLRQRQSDAPESEEQPTGRRLGSISSSHFRGVRRDSEQSLTSRVHPWLQQLGTPSASPSAPPLQDGFGADPGSGGDVDME